MEHGPLLHKLVDDVFTDLDDGDDFPGWHSAALDNEILSVHYEPVVGDPRVEQYRIYRLED